MTHIWIHIYTCAQSTHSSMHTHTCTHSLSLPKNWNANVENRYFLRGHTVRVDGEKSKLWDNAENHVRCKVHKNKHTKWHTYEYTQTRAHKHTLSSMHTHMHTHSLSPKKLKCKCGKLLLFDSAKKSVWPENNNITNASTLLFTDVQAFFFCSQQNLVKFHPDLSEGVQFLQYLPVCDFNYFNLKSDWHEKKYSQKATTMREWNSFSSAASHLTPHSPVIIIFKLFRCIPQVSTPQDIQTVNKLTLDIPEKSQKEQERRGEREEKGRERRKGERDGKREQKSKTRKRNWPVHRRPGAHRAETAHSPRSSDTLCTMWHSSSDRSRPPGALQFLCVGQHAQSSVRLRW